MTEKIEIKKGITLEGLANIELYESPILVHVGRRKALLREVNYDHAELLVRQGNNPALAYLDLDNYRVVNSRLNIPDDSYVFEPGCVFDDYLKEAGL